ncbi:MAG: hypothetical protein DRJ50_15730, partial [Actinobacteria bacterium]
MLAGAVAVTFIGGCSSEVSPSAGSVDASTSSSVQDVEGSTSTEATEQTKAESTLKPTVSTEVAPGTSGPADPESTSTNTLAPPDPPPSESQLEQVHLSLEPVFEVFSPTGLAWRAGDGAMYVTTQNGMVLRLEAGEASTVIDLSDETAILEPGSERGLLGIAFDPDGERMYLNMTDNDHDTIVISFELEDGEAVLESRREVLAFDQPGLGHNGGRLLFDNEGNLYIGSGDGGASNGRDAQDTSKLLGAILRIRPNPDGDGYEIP